MKIGCIYTAFNTVEYLRQSLQPWIEARRTQLNGHTFLICAVNCAFEGFENPPTDDGTAMTLQADRSAGFIDHVITSEHPIKETEARGRALQWLVAQGCDYSILVDSDEFWTAKQIAATLAHIGKQPLITWFRVCYRNYVFDDKTYLVEPFAPPRIHRLRWGNTTAYGFWDDNNVLYTGGITRDLKRDTIFASATVPKGQVWVKHISWPNSQRSRRKIEYQLKGRGWPQCSFSWDDSRGGLIFNPAMPAPEIAREGEGGA